MCQPARTEEAFLSKTGAGVQGLPEVDATSLRSHFLSKAEAIFPTRAARRQKSAEAGD